MRRTGRFWERMAGAAIKIPAPKLGVSTMLPIHHPMPMGHPRDAHLAQPSNPLYMLQPLKWAGIQVQLFLTYKHTSPTVLQLEPRLRILPYITLLTIARMVTRITTVEINRLRSGWRLPNQKTSVQ